MSVVHGRSAYVKGNCYCLFCAHAHADYTAARRARGLPPDSPRHGTANGYNNYGCRCEPCRQAWSDYLKSHRARKAAA